VYQSNQVSYCPQDQNFDSQKSDGSDYFEDGGFFENKPKLTKFNKIPKNIEKR